MADGRGDGAHLGVWVPLVRGAVLSLPCAALALGKWEAWGLCLRRINPFLFRGAAVFLTSNTVQQGTAVRLCCVPSFPERGPSRCRGEEGDCDGAGPITLLLALLSRFNPSVIFPTFVHPETHFLHISTTQRCPSNLPVPKPSHLRASPPPPPPHQLPYPPTVTVLAKALPPSSPSSQAHFLFLEAFKKWSVIIRDLPRQEHKGKEKM